MARYCEFDVFLFPGLHDTGGYAAIEAMFNALPVNCPDSGGRPVAVVWLGPARALSTAIRFYGGRASVPAMAKKPANAAWPIMTDSEKDN
jgi:hypothetical protein